MLMMRPPLLRAARAWAKVRLSVKTELRFTSSTASQSSSLVSRAGARRMMPALLTRMSAGRTVSRMVAAALRSARSTCTRMARRPASRTALAVSRRSPRATSATSAPASARATAMAAPRPREAPVTIAVCPSSRKRSTVFNGGSEASEREAEVVARVVVIEDRLGKLVRRVESVEEAGQRPGHLEVADGVEAGVGAERAPEARVRIAQSAEVVLLDPAAGVVHDREAVQQRRLVARRRARLGAAPAAQLVE